MGGGYCCLEEELKTSGDRRASGNEYELRQSITTCSLSLYTAYIEIELRKSKKAMELSHAIEFHSVTDRPGGCGSVSLGTRLQSRCSCPIRDTMPEIEAFNDKPFIFSAAQPMNHEVCA